MHCWQITELEGQVSNLKAEEEASRHWFRQQASRLWVLNVKVAQSGKLKMECDQLKDQMCNLTSENEVQPFIHAVRPVI